MEPIRVFFVCTYFGGRAKIAELEANRLTDEKYEFFPVVLSLERSAVCA